MTRTAWRGDAATEDAEPWDAPIVTRADRRRYAQFMAVRPSRPERLADVPAAALDALAPVCGDVALDRLFLVPGTIRQTGNGQSVFAPGRVLAFGESVVAVWIEVGEVIASPIAELAAIDDRTILLHGRLRLIGRSATVAIRYNVVARDELAESIAWLRGRMTTPNEPVEPRLLWIDRTHRTEEPLGLPYRWRFLLQDRSIRWNPAEPAVVAAGDLADIVAGGPRAAGGIAVLDSRELVIATEPTDWSGPDRYGVDRLIVPRDRLRGLHWDREALTVLLDGVEPAERAAISLPIEPHLAEAARVAFGDRVSWV